MATGPKKTENRGGYRPGSGRKPNEISNKTIDGLLSALKENEKKHGTTWQQELADIMWGTDKAAKIRVGKILTEVLATKHSSKDININEINGPQIGLPEIRQDPAKVIAIGGKAKDD